MTAKALKIKLYTDEENINNISCNDYTGQFCFCTATR